jgi:hypothetical protein
MHIFIAACVAGNEGLLNRMVGVFDRSCDGSGRRTLMPFSGDSKHNRPPGLLLPQPAGRKAQN